ncbi:hypothetical protein ACUNWD_07225 [Sunxiuqinia sp. A32]|uniref:hypothetical protein n=1 Tax=Sunxiuqinia sp. A32 TaxID=3461496 RepID=UPI00404679D8
MRVRFAHFLLINALIAASLLMSCENEEGEHENETKISSYNSDESHKAGENCMNCHKSGGPGEGRFSIAGTVFNESNTSILPGATIKLYSEANGDGELIATIQVDKKGNFYTTETIDFATGLYTLVEGSTSTQHMNSSVTSGQCNSCHNSNNRIWGK